MGFRISVCRLVRIIPLLFSKISGRELLLTAHQIMGIDSGRDSSQSGAKEILGLTGH